MPLLPVCCQEPLVAMPLLLVHASPRHLRPSSDARSPYVAFLVAMPGAPSSYALAPSSVLGGFLHVKTCAASGNDPLRNMFIIALIKSDLSP